jgi:hypothetical protein
MRWLIVGNSLTEGMMQPLADAMEARGIAGGIVAHQGWGTGRWLRSGEVQTAISKYDPDLVVYILGTNDDPFNRRAVEGLVALAPDVRWVGPFHSDAMDGAFRELLGDRFVPGVPLTEGLRRTPDGIHFPGSSSEVLAERIVEAIQVARRLVPGWLVVGGVALAAFAVMALFSSRRSREVWEKDRWRAGQR